MTKAEQLGIKTPEKIAKRNAFVKQVEDLHNKGMTLKQIADSLIKRKDGDNEAS